MQIVINCDRRVFPSFTLLEGTPFQEYLPGVISSFAMRLLDCLISLLALGKLTAAKAKGCPFELVRDPQSADRTLAMLGLSHDPPVNTSMPKKGACTTGSSADIAQCILNMRHAAGCSVAACMPIVPRKHQARHV